MTANEPVNNIVKTGSKVESVCDFRYLNEMVNGKKQLIKGIMDVFLKEVPNDLKLINEAVTKTDYTIIKGFAHTLKSSVSVMGISVLKLVLSEMEDLAAKATGIDKIKELYEELNVICMLAMKEIEKEKLNYLNYNI